MTKYDLKRAQKKKVFYKPNCILVRNPNQYVYVISKDVTGKFCPNWKIRIDEKINWDIERIIWIAFYKNEKNKKCVIQLLPKDVVKSILALIVSNSSLFL